MHPAEFVAKWKRVELKERSAAQEHFIDLCRLVDHPTPVEADPTGDRFCFERGASKHGGGEGFADVWKKDYFGWEYKGRHKDLAVAYDQLLRYRDALANPPLLVVSDMDRIVVHTNFTKTASETTEIALDKLGEERSLEVLRSVFFDPERLRPGQTSANITQEAAQRFAGIAGLMRAAGTDPVQVARFLDRVVFCLFAEDIGLLPDLIFTKIVDKAAGDPSKFARLLGQLFEAMGSGGEFGLDSIRHFNGNLFSDAVVPAVNAEQVRRIAEATGLDWSSIDPSIFGTLFERGLDPAKRSQLGAHFTSREDIEILVDAVVMPPLNREWADVRQRVEKLLAGPHGGSGGSPVSPAAQKSARSKVDSEIRAFLARLQNVKILDPACGSGNFLYVSLQRLLDLEKAVTIWAFEQGLASFIPRVGPWQLYGIEINPYAHDLAQTTVWIGWLQWLRANGFGYPQEPILRPMDGNFQCRDAILDLSDPENPKEPEWPKVDFIVGNPPFLGGKFLRRELGDEYVDHLLDCWRGRVRAEADLCCYWFEKARAQVEHRSCRRAGLLATQGIRGGANRKVLERIRETGDIFWAISDQDWVLDGASVHVSLIAFDGGEESDRTLDGQSVAAINATLSGAADITQVRPLAANRDIAFMGSTKGAAFDIEESQAVGLLRMPNPHGRPNSDVVVPWVNGMDVAQRPKGKWIIDFGPDMPEADAARYEAVFEHLRATVRPDREAKSREEYRKVWWQHVRPRAAMRSALSNCARFLGVPRVAKYRLFVWESAPTLPDCQIIVFARADDYFFGVLHSRVHEIWALKLGTRLETRPRYTPTTCFETFPLPQPTAEQERTITAKALELNALRERWLNPPEWTREEVLEFPGTVGGPWDRYIQPDSVDEKTGIGLVKYPRIVPLDEAFGQRLRKRTLTNLYNARPAWLASAHRKLDEAVFAAYGWPADLTDDEIVARLLELNLRRSTLERA